MKQGQGVQIEGNGICKDPETARSESGSAVMVEESTGDKIN